MGASITLAGESLIAQKQASQQLLVVKRFIFANVPGLDPAAPVDRAAAKPAAARLVYTADIPAGNAGYVNPNQVVYSLQVGSDVGDWDFNWIGLESAEGVLFAVAYVPLQQKRRNIPPLQLGNNITRNFLVVFDGAQVLTGLTIDARTWQHDFTVRLAGIDERARKANRDLYGRRLHLNSGLLMEKVGNAYQLKPGVAYVEGLRVELIAALPVAAPPSYPTYAWLDVSLQRQLNDVVTTLQVVYGNPPRADYLDANGITHYSVIVAQLVDANTLVDSRIVVEASIPLLTAFALKNGTYPDLRAQATTKEDVKLGNIPNAISDDQETNSSAILATTKAVKAASALIWTGIANIISGATVVGKAAKWATSRKITVAGAVTGSVDLDGSSDVILSVVQTQATEGVAGGSKVATQAQTDTGADDAAHVTPKKLRWGFNASWTTNGCVVFPSWLGGLIFQWGEGVVNTATDSVQVVAFPLTFPNACYQVLPGTVATGSTDDAHYILTGKTLSNATFKQESDNMSAHNIKPVFFAVGR